MLLAHHWTLGFGSAHPFGVDIAGAAVAGFFVLSGFLIARSAAHHSAETFLWRRCLRIFPAFWLCLFFTAAVVAPLLWWRTHGGLQDFWTEARPFDYVIDNWALTMGDMGLGDLFVDTPAQIGDVANPSLWTLRYEFLCYLGVLVAANLPAVRRQRWLPAAGCLALYGVIVLDFVTSPDTPGPFLPNRAVEVPLLGRFDLWWLGIYGFMFALGVAAYVYRGAIGINDRLGISASVIAILGGFTVPFFGPLLPVAGYALLWCVVRLPRACRRIGTTRDLSYGIYIYAGLCQQVLAVLGVARFGHLPFLLLTLALTIGAASFSWSMVERPAMRLKDGVAWRLRQPAIEHRPVTT